MSTALDFKGSDPGAVQYGNFINYYSFHPPEERIKLLPQDIWDFDQPYVLLDIGCNTGDLSRQLIRFFTEKLSSMVHMLGVDIDPTLITRAKELTLDKEVSFQCLDIMDMGVSIPIINDYLTSKSASNFGVVFCFSTTMWIHLNYGDSGLKRFLMYISSIATMLVIEPQPWKCYRNAVRRMKKQGFKFNNYSTLTIKDNVEYEIERILVNDCDLAKVEESEKTKWRRRVLIFKRKT